MVVSTRFATRLCPSIVTCALFIGGIGSADADTKGTSSRVDVVPNHYFVAFKAGVTRGNIAAVKSAGAVVRDAFPMQRAILVEIRSPRQAAALARDNRVDYVEPEPMRYAMDLGSSQPAPSTLNGLYGLVTTRSTETHARGVTGSGINVGVADTGLDYNHPDIASNYKGGTDKVSNDSDPYWNNDPNETHGTHVAGTVLGAHNTVGVYGVAYNANLYHARVLGPGGGSTSGVMNGVRWLVETAKCKVVNLSLGGRLKSRTEENFYKEMRNKGALVVCAAGNDGASTLSYPAGYAVNIAVGAVDRNSVRASFSNTGKNIDVVAPGVSVLSSVPANQGYEASVTTSSYISGFPLEYSGTTAGAGGTLVNCARGKVGEFPAGVAGNIALIQRGDISFAEKVTNAMAAGATAAILYNNVAGDFLGTLGSAGNWIPAITVSDAAGTALVAQAGSAGNVVSQTSSWDAWDGTSMATPHVTGVVALIWSANLALSNTTVESYLFTTCADLGAAGYDTIFGRGLVNASAAVAKTGK